MILADFEDKEKTLSKMILRKDKQKKPTTKLTKTKQKKPKPNKQPEDIFITYCEYVLTFQGHLA